MGKETGIVMPQWADFNKYPLQDHKIDFLLTQGAWEYAFQQKLLQESHELLNAINSSQLLSEIGSQYFDKYNIYNFVVMPDSGERYVSIGYVLEGNRKLLLEAETAPESGAIFLALVGEREEFKKKHINCWDSLGLAYLPNTDRANTRKALRFMSDTTLITEGSEALRVNRLLNGYRVKKFDPQFFCLVTDRYLSKTEITDTLKERIKKKLERGFDVNIYSINNEEITEVKLYLADF
ncbi:MAG TPA: hypothetical protein VLG12_06230 [Candidatus Saccharimonadales bacterium]|nr:hypothetical protein [Candidatus Saccharimonadales bacterium]